MKRALWSFRWKSEKSRALRISWKRFHENESSSAITRLIWRCFKGDARPDTRAWDRSCDCRCNQCARRKSRCSERSRSRPYLAFRSLLLELPLLGLFLGDASLDRCQGLPRERTEQTSFFLWYRVRIFGHCLGCAQLSHLPASGNRDQWGKQRRRWREGRIHDWWISAKVMSRRDNFVAWSDQSSASNFRIVEDPRKRLSSACMNFLPPHRTGWFPSDLCDTCRPSAPLFLCSEQQASKILIIIIITLCTCNDDSYMRAPWESVSTKKKKIHADDRFESARRARPRRSRWPGLTFDRC